jgi:Cu(I)/Ag(I) efflux system membrane fusion protein
VVSNGAFKIDSELQIQAKPSMMSPEGGGPTPGHQHEPSATTSTTAAIPSGDDTAARMVQSSTSVRKALAPVYAAYFEIWEALAGDDLIKAKKSGKNFRAAVEEVDMAVFAGPAHERWMGLSKSLSSAAAIISDAKDMETARDAFYDLSKATIDLRRDFGHTGSRNFYLSFCPMARDGEGAYWLQDNDELLNPYYGASMLYCGSVKETYRAISGEER